MGYRSNSLSKPLLAFKASDKPFSLFEAKIEFLEQEREEIDDEIDELDDKSDEDNDDIITGEEDEE